MPIPSVCFHASAFLQVVLTVPPAQQHSPYAMEQQQQLQQHHQQQIGQDLMQQQDPLAANQHHQQPQQPPQVQQQLQQPFWRCGWSFGAAAGQVIDKYMEDRHVAVDLSGHPAFAGVHRAGLFAVFDGHGGTQTAEYLQEQFLQHLLAAGPAVLAADPQGALAAAVQLCEQEVLAKWTPGDLPASGSTLCAVLLVDDKLHIANVGDSRAVLVAGTSAQPLTQDHSLQCPNEQRRVSDADPDAISIHDKEYIYGTVKLSRGIGCAHLKYGDGSKSAYIATPDVSTRQLAEADDFLIVGSDGAWDVFKQLADYVHPARRAFSEGGTAESVAQLLLHRAKGLETHDNVTVVVVRLHNRRISVPRSNSRLQLTSA
jgi:serine/threonine protein phosphatase PrpC